MDGHTDRISSHSAGVGALLRPLPKKEMMEEERGEKEGEEKEDVSFVELVIGVIPSFLPFLPIDLKLLRPKIGIPQSISYAQNFLFGSRRERGRRNE